MSEDMSDMMNKIKSMLQNGQIPDNVKEAMNQFTNSKAQNNNNQSEHDSSSNNSSSGINPEMISNLVNMFNNSKNEDNTSHTDNAKNSDNTSGFNIDIDMLLKMKTIMEKMNDTKDDPRSNLLLSLKPYLKKSRKDKVEQYIKLFNMSKVMDVLKSNGGDAVK